MKSVATALLLLPAVLGVASAKEAKRPNLVMMVVDDLGWTDVSYHGSNFHTPNIDALAAEGVKLDKYYVQQVCSPTRSALLTGRYPFHTGLQHTTTLAPGTRAAIPKDTQTIAEALKKSGYKTHAIGKWHLGFQGWDDTPIGRGFDSFAGYLNGAIDYYKHNFLFKTASPNGTTSIAGLDFWRNKTAAWDYEDKHSTPFYMDEAKRVLDNHNGEDPFFIYFAHQLVHEPLEEPTDPNAIAACKNNNVESPLGEEITKGRHSLCTMASNVDTAIGEFVDMLKAKGMWDNTILWLTTDNGGMTSGLKADGAGAWSGSSNYPLRGGKGTLFEGGVRGISFVAGGALPAAARGKETTELMQHVDIPATMAALAGAEWSNSVDGLNVWDAVVKGAPSNRAEVPINVDTCVGITGGPPCGRGHKYNAIINGKWKLIEANWQFVGCPNTTWCTGAGLYDGWWSNDPYNREAPNAAASAVPEAGLKNGGIWLFDLANDPNERKNVAAENPDVVDTMRSRLAELAQRKNGYRNPQFNIPNARSNPTLHNGTWAPFRRLGEKLPVPEIAVEVLERLVREGFYTD